MHETSFSPEILDDVVVARRELRQAPMKLNEGETSCVVGLERVVASMAQLEPSEEVVMINIAITCRKNNFNSMMAMCGWNEQV